MNSKFLPVLLTFLSILLSTSFSFAQVTVGVGLEPEKGALIDFKEKPVDLTTFENSTKGVLFPKVLLVARKSLLPVIQGTATSQDSLLTKGMVVYNVSPDAIDEGQGLYVWNGSEWFPVFGSNSSGFADLQLPFDCSSLKVTGTYTKGESLKSTVNYIDVNVTVTKPGSYNAVAIPSGNGNGYYFSTSGVFKMAGSYTIRLMGMGTPANSNDLNNPDSWDKFQLSVNGITTCNTSIHVQSAPADYQLICSSLVVNGSYAVGTSLNSANNTISLKITAPQSSAGVPYIIKTDSLNGFYFTASGVLSGGTQNIVLSGYGTPHEAQQTYFTITTNSTNSNVYCNTLVNVSARVIKILSFGGYWYNWSSNQTDGTGVTYYLLHNSALFGPSTAIYPIAGFSQTPAPASGAINRDVNVSALISQINTLKPDIITGGYEWNDLNNANSTVAAQFASVLTQYVNQGGVLVFYNDVSSSTSGNYMTGTNLIRKIFNNNTLSLTGGSDGPNTVPIVTEYPPITNGLFMDLTGKSVQRDSGNNGYVHGTDPNMAAIAKDSNGARAIVHKNLGFFYACDGGFFTGNRGNTATDSWPLKVDNNYYPLVFTNNNSANAHLFCNVVVWAINKAQNSRPTGNEPFNIVTP